MTIISLWNGAYLFLDFSMLSIKVESEKKIHFLRNSASFYRKKIIPLEIQTFFSCVVEKLIKNPNQLNLVMIRQFIECFQLCPTHIIYSELQRVPSPRGSSVD